MKPQLSFTQNSGQCLRISKYLLLPLVIGLTQFTGFSIPVFFLLVISGSLLISKSVNLKLIRNNQYGVIFIILSIIIGTFKTFDDIPSLFSVVVWGQLGMFAIMPYFVKNSVKLFVYLKYIIVVWFFLDVGTNILLSFKINVPWVEMTLIRPNEIFARHPGIKGSHLFSGLISFLMLSTSLDATQIKLRKYRVIYIALSIINLLLAGARRSIILGIIVLIVYIFKKIRQSKVYLLIFITSAITGIFLVNIYTMENNPSNFLRYELWVDTLVRILKNPMLGHGFFYPTVKNVAASLIELSQAGVTESFILLIGYCFGLPALLFFILFIIKTIINSTKVARYTATFGVFLGLSIEQFFGGSLENTLACILFFTSASLINSTFQ